jgi:hypothetical protein
VATATAGKSVLAAKTEYYWIAPVKIELLHVAGLNSALFEQMELNLFAFGVKSVALSFNGEPVKPEKKEIDTVRGAVFNVNPAWKKGRNTLNVEAMDGEGRSVSKEYAFYFMPEHNLAKGDAVTIEYGYPGSKSGPFFYTELDGGAIRLTDKGETRAYMINEQGWLMPDYKLIAGIEGAEPGGATVRVFKKDHFTMDRKPEREITFTVIP